MNVAVHMKRFGDDPKIVSRIGDDELGNELLGFLQRQGMNTDFVQMDHHQPTGVVNVEIAENGDASYDIVFPSAWDFIEYPPSLFETGDSKVLVFGSLASRNADSQKALFSMLDQVDTALFDVNFRAPHYAQELVEKLLHRSHIVKLNEHEIKTIGRWLNLSGADDLSICHEVARVYNVPHIILTMGGDGAMVLKDHTVARQPGFKVQVKDTVGSGDSFLASYLAHFLAGDSIERSLEMACATGAFVASSDGAVPDYKIDDIKSLINQ